MMTMMTKSMIVMTMTKTRRMIAINMLIMTTMVVSNPMCSDL